MGTERQVMQEYLDALVKRADFPSYLPVVRRPRPGSCHSYQQGDMIQEIGWARQRHG
jgi:hypothetical protein